jgi:hypothetical protein
MVTSCCARESKTERNSIRVPPPCSVSCMYTRVIGMSALCPVLAGESVGETPGISAG